MLHTTPEENKKIAELTIKSIIGVFPVFGSFVKDVLLDYRSQVRQDRINHFVGLLEDELVKMNINPTTLKTEENVDLFESIFQKVIETRSEQKRVGFKNILIHGIKDNQQVEYCELFSNLLLELHSKEIEILFEYQKYTINGEGPLTVRNRWKNELEQLERQVRMGLPEPQQASTSKAFSVVMPRKTRKEIDRFIKEAETMLKEYEQKCTAETFKLSEDEYQFFLQNLSAKGLLVDDGVGAIGVSTFEIMSLTKFGKRFLSFIGS
jgi:hypothetical protein